MLCLVTTSQALVIQATANLSFKNQIAALRDLLTRDFTEFWIYKDLFFSPSHIGATPKLIQKSIANLGDRLRLRRLLINAFKGEDVSMPIIGGSISRGAPFSEQGNGSRIYFHAIKNWWNTLFAGISGSKLIPKSVSLGGVGTDYFAFCLDSHLRQDFTPELLIWELAANDRGRYKDMPFPPGQPLEQFIRNAMQRYSRPALILLNFFRGADVSETSCPNYEDEGGLAVAAHYNITSLSWRNYVCDYIQNKDLNFGKNNSFALDNFHPSILGHAQMAFIVINYLRNEFLRTLKGPAGQTTNIEDFVRALSGDFYVLPRLMFPETSLEKPLCFTYFRYSCYEPNNTLAAQVTRQDNFKYNIFKQFVVRTDKLCGMQTDLAEQMMQFTIYLPRSFSRLIVVSHSERGSAQLWLDRQTPVVMRTDDYHMGTLLKIVSTNLAPGRHVLNALSLKHGFVVCSIAVI